MTHNYSYNFGFLGSWFASNPGISRRDVLTALCINDYKTLQNWTDGINIMPLTQILRFCNAFSVPLECFFCDGDARASVVPVAPTVNTQTEPSGGWRTNEGKGGRHNYDPRTSERMESVLPYPTPLNGKGDSTATATAKACGGTAMATANATSSEVAMEKVLDIAMLQDKMQTERLKYLDIISRQMDQIVELTKRIESMCERPYDVIREYGEEDMVRFAAEERKGL